MMYIYFILSIFLKFFVLKKNRNIYWVPETTEIICGIGFILVQKITKWGASVCLILSSLESKIVADGTPLDVCVIVFVFYLCVCLFCFLYSDNLHKM